jgi:threonine dehydrogenase-like Zn-dependent dehydrogenase
MKAVAFVERGKMELRDLPDADPKAGEVALAVAYCGVCGSDVHEYETTTMSPRTAGIFQPVMGHEFTAKVLAAGEGVTVFAPGDAVVVHPGDPCGACEFCARGESNLCRSGQMGTGYGRAGAYAEQCTVRASSLVKLPDDSWLERSALTEPFAVALHALNRAGLEAGESVFVTGAGPIGLLTVVGAKLAGAAQIIVSEPAAPRRELALRMGADTALEPKEAVKRILESTSAGADIAVECAGVSPAMDDCRAAVRRGGRIVLAGFNEGQYPLDLGMTLFQEHTILGSFGYANEFEEAANLITTNAVDLTPLVSRVVPLEELPSVFAALVADRGYAGKVLVAPNGKDPD